MRHRRFAGRDAWMAAVEQALAHPAALPILTAKALDVDAVRSVAGAEAARASDLGISCLSADQLADAAGLPRTSVLRARLALVELGLEDVVPGAGAGNVRRELHHDCCECANTHEEC